MGLPCGMPLIETWLIVLLLLEIRAPRLPITLERNVKGVDIDLVNSWSEWEVAKGRRPAREMKYHYADESLILKPCLRYNFSH